ncbi:hypothetical protein [Tessaracoccus sp. G1721]
MTTGRRALPEDVHHPVDSTAPRRGADPAPSQHVTLGPRHGIEYPEPDTDTRRAWLAIGLLGIVMAVAIAALYLVVGGRGATTAPSSPSASTSAPAESATPAATQDGSTSGTPTPLESPSPTPSAPASPLVLDLGDVTLVVPEGWELYADEVVQDGRRLVRVREPLSDTRVQAVTLTTVGADLAQACRDLVTDQQQAFTGVAESVVVDVPMTGAASGASCAFTGTRTEDGVAAKVEFTLIRREADSQTLIFRDTVPSAVPASAEVLAQLAVMECAAAETFGVVVTSCQG